MPSAQQGVRQSSQRWHAVPRTLSFVRNGADVLLLKGAPNKRIWPNQYNGLGGHVEPEEDVLASARREILEESGLAVHDLRLRGVTIIDVHDPQGGILLFTFSAWADTRDVKPSNEGTLEWVPQSRLAEYDLVEDLAVLLPRVLAMPDGAPPYFARYAYDENDRLVITFAENVL